MRSARYVAPVSFDVEAGAYDRFMGRFAGPLAVQFAGLLGVRPGLRVLDVGCGPGALTAELVRRGASVSAVDPSGPFVAAVRDRLPGVDVRQAPAEALPYADATFDAAAAQLVVHFMADPVAGLAEMARVTRPGGPVAACVWDHADRGPLSVFWRAARDLDPAVRDESALAGATEGHLADLSVRAGLTVTEDTTLTVRVTFPTFAAWWDPFTLGVGPAGAHVAALSPAHRTALATRCAALLPPPPFTLPATTWTVLARRAA